MNTLTKHWECELINPLSPNIHIQILQTDLHTFPVRNCWENLIKDQGIFSVVIILAILITFSLDIDGYCLKKIDVGHCWDLKGYYVFLRRESESVARILSDCASHSLRALFCD